MAVRSQARSAFLQFERNPWHASLLYFKAIHGRHGLYSARVGENYRALATRMNDEVVWFGIGTHADFDQLLCNR